MQIEGFDYVGLGSANNKKDAETNAAKDFCGFLIGAGIIPPDSFPDDLFVSRSRLCPEGQLIKQTSPFRVFLCMKTMFSKRLKRLVKGFLMMIYNYIIHVQTKAIKMHKLCVFTNLQTLVDTQMHTDVA